LISSESGYSIKSRLKKQKTILKRKKKILFRTKKNMPISLNKNKSSKRI
jgi:hypothetical protein